MRPLGEVRWGYAFGQVEGRARRGSRYGTFLTQTTHLPLQHELLRALVRRQPLQLRLLLVQQLTQLGQLLLHRRGAGLGRRGRRRLVARRQVVQLRAQRPRLGLGRAHRLRRRRGLDDGSVELRAEGVALGRLLNRLALRPREAEAAAVAARTARRAARRLELLLQARQLRLQLRPARLLLAPPRCLLVR